MTEKHYRVDFPPDSLKIKISNIKEVEEDGAPPCPKRRRISSSSPVERKPESKLRILCGGVALGGDNNNNNDLKIKPAPLTPHSAPTSCTTTKKLHLVLDLDHTLLHSTTLDRIHEDQLLYLKLLSFKDKNNSLFFLDHLNMATKLRPSVHNFLKQASQMYELHVFTMGGNLYAQDMVRLLDPGNLYFHNKLYSCEDCTLKKQKGLDVVLGAESHTTVILDDTPGVWTRHSDNLILMQPYKYFGRSLDDRETETDNALPMILKVLKRVHRNFSNLLDPKGIDVRHVLDTTRRQVFKGCNIMFSYYFQKRKPDEYLKLSQMASQLGASCSLDFDSTVTHVVSMSESDNIAS